MPPEDPNFNEDTAFTDAGRSAGDAGNEETADAGRSGNDSTFKRPLGLQRSDRTRAGGSAGLPPPNRSASEPMSGPQADVDQLVRRGLQALESKRRDLQQEIDQLERRKEKIQAETRTSFAGASQDIAIRVQGFKEYLVGSLQDLVTAAEEIDLGKPAASVSSPAMPAAPAAPAPDEGEIVPLAAQRFAEQRDRINSLLDQYRTRPDYYGPPWQLRRTFEPIHADRAANWFFTQGGRGAVKSMGSRLQNVLVASAAISCLYAIYDRRLCVLVLATTPERLGEWRRWLQDCLGIARADFGTNRGVMLFEASEPMTQRAERLLESGRVPFLIMDEAEDKVSLSLLQFPLWLGFAPDPANPSTDYDYY